MSADQYPASLDEAMAIFQADLPSITKDETAKVPGKDGKQGYTYGYAGLDAVSDKVLKRLGALGVSWRARPTLDESGKFVLLYRLRHVSGDEETGTWPIPPGTPQQMGSAITYARRYSLMAVTGVFPTNEDDDGAAASTQPMRQEDWERATPVRPAQPAPRPTRDQLIDAGHKAIAAATSLPGLEQLRARVDKNALDGTITMDDAGALHAAINGREAELTGNVVAEPVSSPPVQSGPIRDEQRRRLFALFNDLGMTDRAKQMGVIRQAIGRDVESRNDLTAYDADRVIGVLEAQVRQAGPRTNGRSAGVAA